MSKVEVLCPNGRRVNVKVNPNTKVLQILDEVCAKQGFQPVSDYELKHGRKTLDVVLSVQFAAIPNLAKLELVRSTRSRAEAPVVIALQLDDGQRLTREFLPLTTLWDILTSFEQDDGRGGGAKLVYSRQKELQPVCLYLKDEVVGETALRNTTLRQLGLTSGRAIVRHYFKEVASAELDAINRRVEDERDRRLKLAAIAAASAEQQGTSPQSPGGSGQISAPPTALSTERPSADVQPMDSEEGRQDGSRDSSHTPVYQRLEEQPFSFDRQSAAVVPRSNAGQQQQPSWFASDDSDWQPRAGFQQQSFAEFKFPEETKGKEVYKNELSDFKREECQPCDREPIVYHINESAAALPMEGAAEELPDEFFQVTESDIRVMFADLRKKALENSDQLLMTKAMRRQEMYARLAQYTRVILRIQFPDGCVVQGIFKPLETVFAVHKFVKELLKDKHLDFELYTSPPKVPLKDMTANLLEANLVPLTLVYFGLPFKCDQYLSDEVICRMSSKHDADLAVVRHMPRSTTSQNSSTAGASSSQSPGEGQRRSEGGSSVPQGGGGRAGSSGGAGAGNVPKWFKTGK